MITEKIQAIAKSKSAQGVLAKYLLKKENLLDLKISDVTEECFVSIATPTRLAKKIGLSGFTELKLRLISERKQIVLPNYNPIIKGDYTFGVVDQLKKTFDSVSDNTLDTIAKCIHDAKKIDFYTVGETNLVAQDLAFKLDRLGKNITVYSDFNEQYIQAKKSDSSTIAIAISYSGMSLEVLKATKIAHKHGARTILLSKEGYVNSSLADYFIGLKLFECVTPKDKVILRITILSILDLIYLKLINQDNKYYFKQLNVTKYHN